MNRPELATLVDVLGFLTGGALYALLLVVATRAAREAWTRGAAIDRLPLAAAVLGLLWNASALAALSGRGLGFGAPPIALMAFGFAALGLLPAVVVHSALREAWPWPRDPSALAVTALGYALGVVAAVLHGLAATTATFELTPVALRLLTIGFGTILVLLGLLARRGRRRRALATATLAVFAITALHWSHHQGGESWLLTLFGHHASMPLAFAILYEDYRFALADIFLKRALTLLTLVAVSSALCLGVAAPMLTSPSTASGSDAWAVGGLIALWISTALAFPAMQRGCAWLVDTFLLRRANYQTL